MLECQPDTVHVGNRFLLDTVGTLSGGCLFREAPIGDWSTVHDLSRELLVSEDALNMRLALLVRVEVPSFALL